MTPDPIAPMATWRVLQGDVLERLRDLPDESVNCVVTSPPYWGLRDYGVSGQIGLEDTLFGWVAKIVEVFREVRRVLRKDGTAWLNLGDSYASDTGGGGGGYFGEINRTFADSYDGFRRLIPEGLKPKDILGQPWRAALALQDDGWYLRGDIIWHKPNPMPESAKDRPTRAHEYLFQLARSERYEYDAAAIAEKASGATGGDIVGWERGGNAHTAVARSKLRESKVPGNRPHAGLVEADRKTKRRQVEWRNKRSVWTIPPQPFPEAHFATFPEALVEPCILAGCPEGGLVLDPFSGSGTTGVVALKRGRSYVGIELNPKYVEMSRRRLSLAAPLFSREADALAGGR